MADAAKRSSHDPSLLDPALLGKLQHLPLFARRPMLGNVSGRHRSPHRGSSVEFAEYRKYVPGDDTRRLDWRAYGRSDRFYLKEFEADTNLRLYLVLDTSGSMNYGAPAGNYGAPAGNYGAVGIQGTGTETKMAYARRLTATLAYLAARQGDAVGLFCASEDLHSEIPPRRSAAHLRHVFDALSAVEAVGATGLADALHGVAEKAPQRALVVIVSDLFVPPENLVQAFQHLRFRKHDVAVFHLLEQAEIDFEFNRPVRFVDLEGGAGLLVEPSVVREAYRDALKRYLEAVDDLVREADLDYHRVRLQDPLDGVLARLLLSRTPKGARA